MQLQQHLHCIQTEPQPPEQHPKTLQHAASARHCVWNLNRIYKQNALLSKERLLEKLLTHSQGVYTLHDKTLCLNNFSAILEAWLSKELSAPVVSHGSCRL
eukprot:TRINITY_DN428_c0_g1_i1.p2 TRINITY_DN428_c0_g1~~TRINITY_DN428_c0_g1_i1.p2  ORF type:complete len:101 (-),score=13.77 TRINITY_DN428_c0_g1_i1:137-439(-)